MDFVTAARTCLFEKYADFNGRASRPEFWFFVLFCIVANAVADIIFRHWVSGLISIALFVPSIAVGTRRLHDTGKSGWLQLLWLIPVIGWLVVIYLMAQPSQAGANEYGPAASDAPPPVEMAPGQQ